MRRPRAAVSGPDPQPAGSERVQPSGRNQLVRLAWFFGLTYAFSWTMFISASRLSGATAVSVTLLILGSFGPSLVAVALTARTEGTAAMKRLLARLAIWRV